MQKIMTGNLMPFLKTSVQISSRIQNTRKLLAAVATTMTQRLFSKGQTALKEISIKDHEEFDVKVLNSDHPVVVNFHAEWCEPCKTLTPQLKELFNDSDQIDLAIIDADHHAELLETFGVKAVPAVLAFNNGMIVDKFIGLVDAKRLDILIGKLEDNKSERISQ